MDHTPYATPRGSISLSMGDSSELEANPNLTLSDKLKIFKNSSFDPNEYVTTKSRSMNEKDIKLACNYLHELKRASAEEMRKSVLANYSAFIRTSKEISDLEGELLSMRNLLSTQAALVHGLADRSRLGSLITGAKDSDAEDMLDEKADQSKTENWLTGYLEKLEVLLAEKRIEEAMVELKEGDAMVEEIKDRKALSPSALIVLEAAITEHRTKLADQLAEIICQPSTRSSELCSSALALKNLGDGPRAHTLLLNSHQEKLHRTMQSLRSVSHSGGAYTAKLSKLVFSTISQAMSDSITVFGEEEPAYASELVTWAVKQADNLASLIKKHVLLSTASAGSLRVSSDCVRVCLSHCYILEAQGLALSPVLLKQFRPFVENALNTNLKRIEQCCAARAAADDWLLAYSPSSRLSGLTSAASLMNASQAPKLSSSAQKFNSMIQEFFEDVGPLEFLELDNLAYEGLLQLFKSYANLLINALPGSVETENLEGTGPKIVRVAETEAQQVALLANALLLADELIPRAVVKVFQSTKSDESQKRGAPEKYQKAPEQRELKKRLQREVDRLRDSFCRQHALELIFTEDGNTRLNALMYLSMDSHAEEPDWFPSPIFQELFLKLSRMASIATDMFVGRERFATTLLMRMSETVILWLSEDQAFWDEIEAGQVPLGGFGLRQLYLDMQFVIIFTSQGRYLSRQLSQVIKNMIARAIDAVAASGLDPNSVLPEDEWFVEVSQIAVEMINGKATFGNAEREVTSPTASISGRSMSSIHSHGSN
ncbi:exocyst complex component EXO84A-like [Prosopis cineraria]|uniref:exocyst complex component EXO84A-like n=1 Tax=Prosopis cineraria TaxID=364024 RepID=UPI00240F2FC9|nr:exocyst complex component EXO84A-like [Prosopis cineraria]